MADALMLKAMQLDEAKRARQREHVKNSYYRQQVDSRSIITRIILNVSEWQNVMKALRQELYDLESEYSHTIQRKQKQLEWREVAEALGSDEYRNRSDDLVEKYMQLSIQKQQLIQENRELALVKAKFAKFQLKTQNLLESQPEPLLEPSPITVDKMVFEPMTICECHQIASQAYQEIEDFRKSNNYLTTGLEILGWREQRREARDHVKFTLKKRFIGFNPSEMSARGWRVVSSPRGLAELYSSTMQLSIEVLQVVDDHNVIMYRVITNTCTMGRVQSLFLVTRFRMHNGYVILFRSVDRNRLRRLHKDGTIGAWDLQGGKWLDMFTWTLFEKEQDNENAVTFSYGGIVCGTEVVNTRVWMLEILSLALRWENKVVGPTLKLDG